MRAKRLMESLRPLLGTNLEIDLIVVGIAKPLAIRRLRSVRKLDDATIELRTETFTMRLDARLVAAAYQAQETQT